MIPLLPLAVVVVEPLHCIAVDGRFGPAGPMLLFEMVLLSLPLGVTPSVLKKILPPFVATDVPFEPRIVELLIVLLVAPPIKRIVLVPEVPGDVVFEIVRLFPPVFKPLIVTLSAPLRSIIGLPAVVAPEIVRAAPPAGDIEIEEYDAEPEPLSFNNAVPVPSSVSPQTSIVIAPVCVPPLIAANAAVSVA